MVAAALLAGVAGWWQWPGGMLADKVQLPGAGLGLGAGSSAADMVIN